MESSLVQEILKEAGTDPIVYCAGPMRGIKDFNFPAFDEARDYLEQFGKFFVVSPADLDRRRHLDLADVFDVPETVFEGCMKLDLAIVAQAHAILLLPGWENSRGTSNEIFVARAAGVQIWFAEYDDVEGILIGHTVLDDAERQAGAPATLVGAPVLEDDTPTILEVANGLIYGDRQDAYGHPFTDFSRTGKMWGAILGVDPVAPELVGLCMVAVKISRQVNRPKTDNLIDMAGYAGCVDRVQAYKEKN
jgi:hypothetical protein